MDVARDERAHAEDALRIFTFLWPMATLFHQASYKLWVLSPADLLLTIAALSAVLGPKSLGRFAFLLVAQLWAFYEKLPEVANHWLLTAFMNLTMLLALLRALLRARGGRIDRAAFYLDFAPALRLELVILYVWASFHKLNYDYLDIRVSCAAFLSGALAARFPFLPSGDFAQHAAVIGSLLVEAGIPLFLCIPRLRVIGIFVGALFHIMLAISPYPPARVYNFSAMLFASYWLFAPEDLPGTLVRLWRGSSLRRALERAPLTVKGLPPVLVALLLWTLASAALFRERDSFWAGLLGSAPNALWIVYATTLLVLFSLGLAAGARQVQSVRRLIVPSAAMAALPLLVFLNGLGPYLGWKTETSFAMFSNLRTEGGSTNHLLIAKPLRLCGYQEDLVTIVETRDPELQWYVDTGHVMTWFEFNDFAARQSRLAVTYTRAGEAPRTIERPAQDPRLQNPPPFWLRKLLWFRPVKVEGPVACLH